MKKIKLILLLIVILLVNLSSVIAKENVRAPKSFPHLLYFYSESCHNCQKIKHELLPEIEKEFFDKIIIEYLDIADMHNYKFMLSLKEKYQCYEDGVPAFFIGGHILVGYDNIRKELRNTIVTALNERKIEEIDRAVGMDLVKRFLNFGALAVILAGLLDGINPCAFTVIVFFISFLALQGYRKRELIIIGASFILAVFLTYILIGLGIFRFLYTLSQFYLLSKIVYYAIAALCFLLGLFALYDLWLFAKTEKTEGMLLRLPQIIKNRIHKIIGDFYRVPKKEGKGSTQKHFLSLIASAFATGFLVSLLEAVCTGQLYLPTITFVLKETSLRIRAFLYLLLYNLMFVVPLIVVLILALWGVTSENFSRFLKERMLFVKLIMAVVFFGLGLVILASA